MNTARFFVVVLMIICGIEILARGIAAQSTLPQSIGSTHQDLDANFRLIERYRDNVGQIDCIVVGSSIVKNGIDTQVFSTTYQELTGKKWNCFNFGLAAITVHEIKTVVRFLVERYQPRLLILGTNLRDFGSGGELAESVADIPILRFYSNDISFAGGLTVFSQAFRYHLALTKWFTTPDAYEFGQLRFSAFNQQGQFFPPIMTSFPIPPIPVSGQALIDFTNYWQGMSFIRPSGVFQSGLAALDDFLLYINEQEVPIIFAELPISPHWYEAYGGYAAYYQNFSSPLTDHINRYGVHFIPVTTETLISDDSWMDFYHLSGPGAVVYSQWLAQQMTALPPEVPYRLTLIWQTNSPLHNIQPQLTSLWGEAQPAILLHPPYDGLNSRVASQVQASLPATASERILSFQVAFPALQTLSDGVDYVFSVNGAEIKRVTINPMALSWQPIAVQLPPFEEQVQLTVKVEAKENYNYDGTYMSFEGILPSN